MSSRHIVLKWACCNISLLLAIRYLFELIVNELCHTKLTPTFWSNDSVGSFTNTRVVYKLGNYSFWSNENEINTNFMFLLKVVNLIKCNTVALAVYHIHMYTNTQSCKHTYTCTHSYIHINIYIYPVHVYTYIHKNILQLMYKFMQYLVG